MITAIILAITLGVLLFLTMVFTIYTESKDFYLTFHVTDFENKAIQHFKIESIELITQVKQFVTAENGQTEKLRINSHAVKTIYTIKVPSILYFKPVFRFPDFSNQYFQFHFVRRKAKHKILIHDNQQSLIYRRGRLYQVIDSAINQQSNNSSISFSSIEVDKNEIKVYIRVNNPE